VLQTTTSGGGPARAAGWQETGAISELLMPHCIQCLSPPYQVTETWGVENCDGNK